jgi:hypothetical protein
MYGLGQPINLQKQSPICIENCATRNSTKHKQKLNKCALEIMSTCYKMIASIYVPSLCCTTSLHSCTTSFIAFVQTILNVAMLLGMHANLTPWDACQALLVVALPPSLHSSFGCVHLQLPSSYPQKCALLLLMSCFLLILKCDSPNP